MKILIVEDNSEKSYRIKNEIVTKYNDRIKISICYNIISAKKNLIKNYYDLMILDLNMPIDEESPCKEDAGYELFKELKVMRNYKMPANIVFCTSYEELHIKYKEEIQKGLFSIIKYDPFSNNWISSLVSKIEQIVQAKTDLKIIDRSFKYDLAIITAVEVEYKFVYELLTDIKTVSVDGDPTTYQCGVWKFEGKEISVVCATQHQMGMTAASVLSMKLISNFKPRVLAMVGIAAGKKGKGNFGDIIAATQIWDYSCGKMATQSDNDKKDSSNTLFLPSPQYLPIDIKIKELLSHNYDKILARIQSEWKYSKIDHKLNLIKGSIACGPSVIQNEDIVHKYIDPQDRMVRGIDMESYGVLFATINACEPRPMGVIFKSICDFADAKKNDDYQSYAAFTSSKFLFYFLMEKIF